MRKIENKDYTDNDIKKIEKDITEYIMSYSSKNGDIGKLQIQYQNIFRTIAIE